MWMPCTPNSADFSLKGWIAKEEESNPFNAPTYCKACYRIIRWSNCDTRHIGPANDISRGGSYLFQLSTIYRASMHVFVVTC